MGFVVSYRADPQILDARGHAPRGNACLGISSEVVADGVAGLATGLAYGGALLDAPTEMANYADLPASLPPDRRDDLMLAVAWGAGPDGADVGELDDSYRRTWVPAAGLTRTTTYIPDGA